MQDSKILTVNDDLNFKFSQCYKENFASKNIKSVLKSDCRKEKSEGKNLRVTFDLNDKEQQ